MNTSLKVYKHNTGLFVPSGKLFNKTNCGYGGSISKGIFPKILPNPVSGPGISIFGTVPILGRDDDLHCRLSDSLYIPHNNYYWINSNYDMAKPAMVFEVFHREDHIETSLLREANFLDDLMTN